jgi:hypothetical protein
MHQTTRLASGSITKPRRDHRDLDRTHRRHTSPRTGALAATPHNSRRQPLPCCGGDDRPHHRRERDGAGTTQGGRPTMSRNLQAFLLSLGGFFVMAGLGLVMLWAALDYYLN